MTKIPSVPETLNTILPGRNARVHYFQHFDVTASGKMPLKGDTKDRTLTIVTVVNPDNSLSVGWSMNRPEEVHVRLPSPHQFGGVWKTGGDRFDKRKGVLIAARRLLAMEKDTTRPLIMVKSPDHAVYAGLAAVAGFHGKTIVGRVAYDILTDEMVRRGLTMRADPLPPAQLSDR